MCRWHSGQGEIGLRCGVPGSLHSQAMGVSCAAHLTGWRTQLGCATHGQAEQVKSPPNSFGHCIRPTLCSVHSATNADWVSDMMPWRKDKNTSLKRKWRWPGNADDAELRLCSCMLIHELWTDFFMLWVSFCNRNWNIVKDWAYGTVLLTANYLILSNFSP